MTNVQPRSDIAYRGTALCDECGSTRQYQRPRNRVYTDTVTWARETGDLKCSTCKRVTRHALIVGYNGDERDQALALGMTLPHWSKERAEREQDEYRRGRLPRNPNASHIWFESVEAEAIKNREPLMRTLCGDMVTTPKSAEDNGMVPKKTLNPTTYQPKWDGSEVDANGWAYIKCVNCLRVHNHMELLTQRRKLKVLMTTALSELLDQSHVGAYDAHVEDLIALLERVHGEGGGQR